MRALAATMAVLLLGVTVPEEAATAQTSNSMDASAMWLSPIVQPIDTVPVLDAIPIQESVVIADIPAPALVAPEPPAVDLSVFTDYNIVHLVWAQHGVDPWVHWKIDCIINYESHWNRYARSRTGDSGLFQVNDIHKWRWKWEDGYLDIYDPWVNAEVAFQVFKDAGYSFRPWSVNYLC